MRAALVTVTLSLVVGATFAGAAGPGQKRPITCSLDPATATLAIRGPSFYGDGVIVSRRDASIQLVPFLSDGPITCVGGTPTVDNVAEITVGGAGGNLLVQINLDRGQFTPGAAGTGISFDLRRALTVVVDYSRGTSDQVVVGSAGGHGATYVDTSRTSPDLLFDGDFVALLHDGEDSYRTTGAPGLAPYAGKAWVYLGPGEDAYAGGPGNDVVTGGPDDDLIATGGGYDNVYNGSDYASDRIDCGADNDSASSDSRDTIRRCERVVDRR